MKNIEEFRTAKIGKYEFKTGDKVEENKEYKTNVKKGIITNIFMSNHTPYAMVDWDIGSIEVIPLLDIKPIKEKKKFWFEKYLIHNDKKKLMPVDVEKVYIHNENVTVELVNGKKGTATHHEPDVFDPYIGFCIAYYKAHNSGNFKLKKALNNCIKSADKKGYKTAILKNKSNETKILLKGDKCKHG
ncbi:MAG: hypothetical protein ACOCUI_04085 [bacterium]